MALVFLRRGFTVNVTPRVFKERGDWKVEWRHKGEVTTYRNWQSAYNSAYIWARMARRFYGV